MKIYAVKDTRTDEFATNQNGRFLYARRADAKIIKTQKERSATWRMSKEDKEAWVKASPFVVVEADIGEFTVIDN